MQQPHCASRARGAAPCGMDAHHVLRTLNPNASHLRATATSLAECTQRLQQHHTELAANRARDRARADAQRQKEQDRVRERLRSASGRQSTGGVERERDRKSRAADGNRPATLEERGSGRVEHADGNRPATLEERGSGRAPQQGDKANLTGKKPPGMLQPYKREHAHTYTHPHTQLPRVHPKVSNASGCETSLLF